jgi:hypothetical protein
MPLRELGVKAKLFVLVDKDSAQNCFNLNIKEVNSPNHFIIKIPFQLCENDIPIFVTVDEKHGMVLILTKIGYLLVYEASTGLNIQNPRIGENPPVSIKKTPKGGFNLIDINGFLLNYEIDEKILINLMQANLEGGRILS